MTRLRPRTGWLSGRRSDRDHREARRFTVRALELLEDRRVLSTLTIAPAPGADGTSGNTLRAAILQANGDTTDSVVNIQLSAGTYALSLGQLELSTATATVQIIGTGSSGPDASIIDAGGTSRILQVDPNVTVVLEDLEITGGQAPQDAAGDAQGGGISTGGNLELDNVLVDQNTAAGANGVGPGDAGGTGQGAGIYVAGGGFTLNNSDLSNDFARGGDGATAISSGQLGGAGGAGQGAGIYVAGGEVTLNNSALSNDSARGGDGGTAISSAQVGGAGGTGQGGGVYVAAGGVILDNCSLTDDAVQGGGGGSAVILAGDGGAAQGGGLFNDGTATLTACTVTDNSAAGGTSVVSRFDRSTGGAAQGGGLFNGGTATLTACTVTGNSAAGGTNGGDNGGAAQGGGVDNTNGGTATLTECTVTDNSAAGGSAADAGGAAQGGGVDNENGGTASLTECTVSGNLAVGGGTPTLAMGFSHSYGGVAQGGGLFNGGTAALTDCSLTGNSTRGGYGTFYGGDAQGGGLFSGGTATLTDCTISGNSAIGGSGFDVFKGGYGNGGGLFNNGTATLTDSTVSSNSTQGGYAYSLGGAAHGGGVFNGGTATLTDCTVSGNSALSGRRTLRPVYFKYYSYYHGTNQISGTAEGGGLFNNRGTATLTDCTVSGNSVASGLTLNLPNKSVPLGAGLFVNYAGTAALTNTIVAGNGGAGDLFGSYSGSNDLIGGNPLLAPLGNYGGPTPTLALLPGSPAIDNGGFVTTFSSAGVTDTSSTSITVANGLVFAASSLPVLSSGSYFLIQVDSEQMAVVGLTLNADNSATLDVARGANGTTAATHLGGASVFLASDERGYTRGGAVDIGAFQDQGFSLTPVNGSTPQTVLFGEPFPLDVTVTANNIGQFVNPVDGGVIAFTVNPAANGATASLSATTATITGGQASVTATANTVPGTYTVTASAAGASPASFSLTNTLAGPASVTVVSGSPQSATVGGTFSPLVVVVEDAEGNLVPGALVTFAAPGSGASSTLSSSTATTGSNGQASITATADTVAGSYTVTATVSGVATPVSFSLTNVVGAPASVTVVSGSGQSAAVGAGFASPLVVVVTDSYGNLVPGASVTFAAPAAGASASLTPPSATTGANGQASVTATANTIAGNYIVTASVTGVTTPASLSLTNNPGAPASVAVVSGSGQAATVAQGFNISLVAVVSDTYGNPVPGVSVTFAAPTSDASATLSSATATTGANGQASVSATANTIAGSYTVTASVSGVTTPAGFNLANNPGAAALIAEVSGSPQSTTVAQGFASPLAVVVEDTYGNPVPNVSVTFAAPASGASATLVPSSARTGANGQASVQATANTLAGSYTVTASAAGVSTPAGFALTQTLPATGVSVIGTVLYIVGGNTSDYASINPAGASNTGATGLSVSATLNGSYTSKTFTQTFTAIVIVGSGGNDNFQLASTLTLPTTVTEGNGNNYIKLAGGNDTVALGTGSNQVFGGNGNKTITAADAAGTSGYISLGNGNDVVSMSAGNDQVVLGAGNDTVTSGNGNDAVTAAGLGNNAIALGNGNDYVKTGNGADVITLGSGNENVQVGDGNKTITAGSGNSYVHSGNGNDAVALGNGNDDVQLGGGSDNVTLGSGNDYVSAGNGDDDVTVGNGNDDVQLGGGNNVVVEGNGNDYVSAGNGANLIVGGLGRHTIQVGSGTNILIDGSATIVNPGDSFGQILSAWAASPTASNQAAIRSRFTVTYNTTSANYLSAGVGVDWFFYQPPTTSNKKPSDFLK
jgi:hypothetical protein